MPDTTPYAQSSAHSLPHPSIRMTRTQVGVKLLSMPIILCVCFIFIVDMKLNAQSIQIIQYQMLELNYESMADWKQTRDLLCCNPSFHRRPRYDCAIMHIATAEGDGAMFARILTMFTCTAHVRIYPIALVQAYDVEIPDAEIPQKDQDLELFRVRARPREETELVSIHSFVRGALLVPDFDTEGDYFVFDVLDGDMFLRVKFTQAPSQD